MKTINQSVVRCYVMGDRHAELIASEYRLW